MPNPRFTAAFTAVITALLLTACIEEEPAPVEVADSDYTKVDIGKADASGEALFLDFNFSGELLTSSTWNLESNIEDQLLYTVGQLNGDNSVGRLDKLELTNIQTERQEDGKTRVTYEATMLVAWGDKEDVPSEYELLLPHDVSYSGQEAFADKYSEACVDWGAHDVDANSMWYYYRPASYRCELDDADLFRTTATLTVSDVNTTGKFPEYHKVWEDDVFEVVAVFGKYKDGATSSSDAGIAAYNEFIGAIMDRLSGFEVTTTPAEYPRNPGIEQDEIVFETDLGDGKRLRVVAMLVDNVRTAGAEFDQRYAELSSRADLIAYNGHSGLGANIRALARKGRWVQGQYAIVFMNGCDTYAYVDSALADAHMEVNPDDTTGTKYVDLVMNAMPAYFHEDSEATMALINGLLSYSEPKTYEQMFEEIDKSQVVLVSGEQDNEFVPGGEDTEEPVADTWEGLEGSGTVRRSEEMHWETPRLPAGEYVFEMTGTSDADLHIRVGRQVTSSEYDCRPYKAGSSEVCKVELSAPTTIYVMVRGWASSSDFELSGRIR